MAIRRFLLGHTCEGVVRAGISESKNGKLLELAETAGFHVLLTVDQGIPYQQDLRSVEIALIVIQSKSNKLEALLPHIKACLDALQDIRPNEIVQIG